MDHPLFTSTEPLIRVIKSLPLVQQATCWHIWRVERRALRMAKALGYERHELAIVKFAARYHDASKFLKEYRPLFFEHQGKFGAREIELASGHAYASAMVTGILWNDGKLKYDFDVVAPGIFAIAGHHWHYHSSKTSYQDALLQYQFRDFAVHAQIRFGNFPLEAARLLKVADFFEARTEQRHYHQPLNPEQALWQLKMSQRREFDPSAIRALSESLKQEALMGI